MAAVLIWGRLIRQRLMRIAPRIIRKKWRGEGTTVTDHGMDGWCRSWDR